MEMKVQAFQPQEALALMDGCLTGGFKYTFICCFGICDCCVTSPVDDYAALLSHQLKHTHKSSTGLEEKNKRQKSIHCTSHFLLLAAINGWVQWYRTSADTPALHQNTNTWAPERKHGPAGHRIIVNSRASLNPAWHCLGSESPPNSDEPLGSSFQIQPQFMQPKMILLWYSFSVLKCGLFKD